MKLYMRSAAFVVLTMGATIPPCFAELTCSVVKAATDLHAVQLPAGTQTDTTFTSVRAYNNGDGVRLVSVGFKNGNMPQPCTYDPVSYNCTRVDVGPITSVVIKYAPDQVLVGDEQLTVYVEGYHDSGQGLERWRLAMPDPGHTTVETTATWDLPSEIEMPTPTPIGGTPVIYESILNSLPGVLGAGATWSIYGTPPAGFDVATGGSGTAGTGVQENVTQPASDSIFARVTASGEAAKARTPIPLTATLQCP